MATLLSVNSFTDRAGVRLPDELAKTRVPLDSESGRMGEVILATGAEDRGLQEGVRGGEDVRVEVAKPTVFAAAEKCSASAIWGPRAMLRSGVIGPAKAVAMRMDSVMPQRPRSGWRMRAQERNG